MKFIRIEDPDFLPHFLERLKEKREYSPEELKEIYAAYKEQFTAADLQKYTEPFEGIPMQQLLRELEEEQDKADANS